MQVYSRQETCACLLDSYLQAIGKGWMPEICFTFAAHTSTCALAAELGYAGVYTFISSPNALLAWAKRWGRVFSLKVK